MIVLVPLCLIVHALIFARAETTKQRGYSGGILRKKKTPQNLKRQRKPPLPSKENRKEETYHLNAKHTITPKREKLNKK